jgi:DNA-binding NarL/FixJ family response regulator
VTSTADLADAGALVVPGGLPARARDVLALMIAGGSNRGIAEQLYLSQKTVEWYVRRVFDELDLPSNPAQNRRVLAVRVALGESAGSLRPAFER